MDLFERISVGTGASDFSCDFDNHTAAFLLLLRRVAERRGLPVKRLLEIGCGSGYALRLWSQVAEKVTGLDLPQSIDVSRKLLAAYPPPLNNIDLVESRAEDFRSNEKYDLIISQYVLEHVDEIPSVLARIRDNLAPRGLAIHVLNSIESRTSWYVEYRQVTSLPRRLYHSWRERGLLKTAADPFNYTVPHEPRFGSFAHELAEYRLDRWALPLLRAGFEILDWFQTSDINWVVITRQLSA
jgi:SAM-dependent methyltransferase